MTPQSTAQCVQESAARRAAVPGAGDARSALPPSQ